MQLHLVSGRSEIGLDFPSIPRYISEINGKLAATKL